MADNLEPITINPLITGSNVASAISTGNYSSSLALNNNSGLGSISTSLTGLGPGGKPGESMMAQTSATLPSLVPGGKPGESMMAQTSAAKSVTASAFGAITSSFKPLTAGKPQNLTVIAAQNAKAQAASQALSPQSTALALATINALALGGKNSIISGATAGLLKQGIGISNTLTSGQSLNQGQITSAISAIGVATGGTSPQARQTASLLGQSIGIGQTLSSGKSLSAGQIGSLALALNSTQGKNAINTSLLTTGISAAATLSSGKSLNQGQISGLVNAVNQIGSPTGSRLNSSTTSLISQSIGIAAAVSSGRQLSASQVSSAVTSSINVLTTGTTTNRGKGNGSGIGALPGGLSAIAAITIGATVTGTKVNTNQITNIATNSVINSVPGLRPWGQVIKLASTSAMNKVPKQAVVKSTTATRSTGAARNAVNNASSEVSDANLASWRQTVAQQESPTSGSWMQSSIPPAPSLATSATSTLEPGDAAALTASVNAINVGGSAPAKLPMVSTGSVDRNQVNSQVSSMFSSNRIQLPNFSGVPPAPAPTSSNPAVLQAAAEASAAETAATPTPTTVGKTEEYLAMKKDYDIKLAMYKDELRSLQNKVKEAKNNLPEGDPEIESLRRQGRERGKTILAWEKEAAAALEVKRQAAMMV